MRCPIGFGHDVDGNDYLLFLVNWKTVSGSAMMAIVALTGR